LQLAGYKVLRYSSIPTEQELREDLVLDVFESKIPVTAISKAERVMKYNVLTAKSS
jgi:hypothetical protein